MAKFSDAKVGDRVWDILFSEWGRIVIIRKKDDYPLKVKFSSMVTSYTNEGKIHKYDKNPTLYWNEVKLPSDEEDKKPFDLVEYLRSNLEPKEFESDKSNFFIFYYHEWNTWEIGCHKEIEDIGLVYLNEKNTENTIRIIKDKLNKLKIKHNELKQAFRELGWL